MTRAMTVKLRGAAVRLGVAAGIALLAAACGPSEDDRLAAEMLAATDPLVTAFAGDLDRLRIDEARARTTREFQAVASPDALRTVVTGQVGVLGKLIAREDPRVSGLVTTPSQQGPVVRQATVSWSGNYEKGSARIEARLARTGADGGWLVDAWTVRNAMFTWRLR